VLRSALAEFPDELPEELAREEEEITQRDQQEFEERRKIFENESLLFDIIKVHNTDDDESRNSFMNCVSHKRVNFMWIVSLSCSFVLVFATWLYDGEARSNWTPSCPCSFHHRG
jgi:hypothetical protein